MAVEILKERGVTEDHILFLNVIASPEGVSVFAKRFPELRIITAFIDEGLDAKKYVDSPTRSQLVNSLQLHCARIRRLRRPLLYTLIACSFKYTCR